MLIKQLIDLEKVRTQNFKLWLQSIQNHAWHRLQAFACCHLSCCAVQFESEQTPLSRTGRRLSSAVLHRIRLGTCCFVPMSYFYSETNEWSKDWVKLLARLWSATTSRRFHRKFHITYKKKWLVAALYLQSIKTFLTLELSQYLKSGSMFSSSEPVAASSDCCPLRNALCLISPVLHAQAVLEYCPKSSAVDFAVKTFDCLLE